MAKANLKKVAAGFAALAMMATAIPANVFSTDYLVSVSAATEYDVSKMTNVKNIYDNPSGAAHPVFKFYEENTGDGEYDAINVNNPSATVTKDDYTHNPAFGNKYVAKIYDPSQKKLVDVYYIIDKDDSNTVKNVDFNDTELEATEIEVNDNGSSYTVSASSSTLKYELTTSGTISLTAPGFETVSVVDDVKVFKYEVEFNGVKYYFGKTEDADVLAEIKAAANTDDIYKNYNAIEEGKLYKGVATVSANEVKSGELLVSNAEGSTRACEYEISGQNVKAVYAKKTPVTLVAAPASAYVDSETEKVDLSTTHYITGEYYLSVVKDSTGAIDNTKSKKMIGLVKKQYAVGTNEAADADTNIDVKIEWYEVVDADTNKYYKLSNSKMKEVMDTIGYVRASYNKKSGEVNSKATYISDFEEYANKDVPVYAPAKLLYNKSYVGKIATKIKNTDGSSVAEDDITIYSTKTTTPHLYVDAACKSKVIPSADIVTADGTVVGKRVYTLTDTEITYKDVFEGAATELGSEANYSNKIAYDSSSESFEYYIGGRTKTTVSGDSGPSYVYELYKDIDCKERVGLTLYVNEATRAVKVGSVLENNLRNAIVKEKKNIKLEVPVTISEDIVVAYDAVINLNGLRISSDGGRIVVADGAKLTLVNGGVDEVVLGNKSEVTLYDAATIGKLTVNATNGVLNGAINKGTSTISSLVINDKTSDWKTDVKALDAITTDMGLNNADPTKVRYYFDSSEIMSHENIWAGTTINNGYYLTEKKTVTVGYTPADGVDSTHPYTATPTKTRYDQAQDDDYVKSFVKYGTIDFGEDIGYICTTKGYIIDYFAMNGIDPDFIEPYDFEVIGVIGDTVLVKCKITGYVTTLKAAKAEMISSSLAKNDSNVPYAQKFSFAITGGGADVQSYGVLYNKDGSAIDTSKVKVDDNGRIVTDYLYTTKTVIKKSGTYSISVGTADENTAVKVIPYVVAGGVVKFGDEVGSTFKAAAQAEAEANCTASVSKAEKVSGTNMRVTFELSAENGYTIKDYQALGTKTPSGEAITGSVLNKIKRNGEFKVNVGSALSCSIKVKMNVVDPYGLEHEIPADEVSVTAK